MRTLQESLTDKQFIERWSARAFSDRALTTAEITALFEAAQWSPSCFNEQPWRFVYSTEGEAREAMNDLLVDGNAWAKKTPLLMVLAAEKNFKKNGSPNGYASFDSGAAWMSLALQAEKMGLSAHAMGGFDKERAYEVIGADKDKIEVICMIAVGERLSSSELTDEQKEKERPNQRESMDSMVFEGRLS